MAKNVLTVRIGLNASEFTRNLNKLKKQIDTTFGKDAVAGSTALMNKLKWLSAGIGVLEAASFTTGFSNTVLSAY